MNDDDLDSLTDDMIDALNDIIESTRKHAQEREAHYESGGESWDWSSHWADTLSEDRKRFCKSLVNLIRAAVKEASDQPASATHPDE